MGRKLLVVAVGAAIVLVGAAVRWASTNGGLVWSDEFDGESLDTSVWRPYNNTYGDGNRELQCYTPANVTVSDGTLKIVAEREPLTCPNGSARQFSSGFLGTRETGTFFPRFGTYEIRARVPHGQGLWPAFWLRHRDGSSTAEVDVMEYLHSATPGYTAQTLHLNGRPTLSKSMTFIEEPTADPGWHIWAVTIAPTREGDVEFSFAVNGVTVHSVVDAQHRWSDAGEDLWDIAINLSVGGNWVGHPDDPLGYLGELDRCAQGGSPPNCASTGVRRATFPAVYEIDYVRVYAH